MSRHDSGFSDGVHSPTSQSPSSPRTSTSSTARRPRRKCPSPSSRPNTKRATKSSLTTVQSQSNSAKRPTLSSRHTAPAPFQYQFTQFPTINDTSAPAPHQEVASPPPLPQTCQYWTSDSTRRLEYAAIDAASRGVRGFFIKLLPDCILPKETRRRRFCEEGDEGSDAGSVRRYRIPLVEEKGPCASSAQAKRPGLLRRFTSGFKGRSRSA